MQTSISVLALAIIIQRSFSLEGSILRSCKKGQSLTSFRHTYGQKNVKISCRQLENCGARPRQICNIGKSCRDTRFWKKGDPNKVYISAIFPRKQPEDLIVYCCPMHNYEVTNCTKHKFTTRKEFNIDINKFIVSQNKHKNVIRDVNVTPVHKSPQNRHKKSYRIQIEICAIKSSLYDRCSVEKKEDGKDAENMRRDENDIKNDNEDDVEKPSKQDENNAVENASPKQDETLTGKCKPCDCATQCPIEAGAAAAAVAAPVAAGTGIAIGLFCIPTSTSTQATTTTEECNADEVQPVAYYSFRTTTDCDDPIIQPAQEFSYSHRTTYENDIKYFSVSCFCRNMVVPGCIPDNYDDDEFYGLVWDENYTTYQLGRAMFVCKSGAWYPFEPKHCDKYHSGCSGTIAPPMLGAGACPFGWGYCQYQITVDDGYVVELVFTRIFMGYARLGIYDGALFLRSKMLLHA